MLLCVERSVTTKSVKQTFAITQKYGIYGLLSFVDLIDFS